MTDIIAITILVVGIFGGLLGTLKCSQDVEMEKKKLYIQCLEHKPVEDCKEILD